MKVGPSACSLIRLSIILLAVTALAGLWELLALQVPNSPFGIGMLPGPIGSFRSSALTMALLLLSVAWLIPWAYQGKEPRVIVKLAYLGVIMWLGGSFYGALNGMYGVQIIDPRPDATALFFIKVGGQLLLVICLGDLARRILFRAPPE